MQPSVEFRNEFLAFCCREVYNININRYNNEKTQILSWFGHMHGMANDRMATKLYQWKSISSRLTVKPKIKWENDIKEDLRVVKINNWTKCIQDWVKWKKVMKTKTFKQCSCSAWRRRRGHNENAEYLSSKLFQIVKSYWELLFNVSVYCLFFRPST